MHKDAVPVSSPVMRLCTSGGLLGLDRVHYVSNTAGEPHKACDRYMSVGLWREMPH